VCGFRLGQGLGSSRPNLGTTGLGDGQSVTFNPATATITIVPEPSMCAMVVAGLAYGGYSIWRCRKRSMMARSSRWT
jgi:hypothetical protein